MNFEVNGIPYMLTYDAGEEQWQLLTASGNGIEAVEIYDDGAPLGGWVPRWNDQGGSQHVN
jgi:hypothetical protein